MDPTSLQSLGGLLFIIYYKEVPVHLFGNLYFLSSNHVSGNNEIFQEDTTPFLLTKDVQERDHMTQ